MTTNPTIPDRLLRQFDQISALPPNDLHSRMLTSLYKFFTAPLKKMPFAYIVPLSLGVAFLMYLVTGKMLINLVTLLQYGF